MEGVWRPSPAAPRELQAGAARRHRAPALYVPPRRRAPALWDRSLPPGSVPSSRAELAEGGRPSDVNWLTIERGQLSARKLAEETDFPFCQK